MAERCPLCGGKLRGNYCNECGYELPDLDEVSKLYDFEPENYPDIETEKANEDIYPPKAPVMYAEPEPVKKIEVVPDPAPTPAPPPPPPPVRQIYPQYNQNGQQYNGQQYAGQNGSSGKSLPDMLTEILKGKRKVKTILVIASLIFPMLGIALGILIMNSKDKDEFKQFGKALLIIGLIKFFTPL